MQLPFHLIANYAKRTKPHLVDTALKEFFKDTPPITHEQENEAFPLFSEWLIYDYRQPGGSSFIIEYTLKNPDHLPAAELSRFEQVTKTQRYGGFEIISIKRGEWIDVEHLFLGEKTKVYDVSSSKTIPDKGTVVGRIACVEGKWYFVGANPFYFSMTYTPRMKKIMQSEKTNPYMSPKETWELVSTPKAPPPPTFSPSDIKKKRETIQKEFGNLKKKYNFSVSFQDILTLVYEENRKSPIDLWQSLFKNGLPEEVMIKHMQLFQDIWNFFPHKILKGKSPTEMFQQLKQAKDK